MVLCLVQDSRDSILVLFAISVSLGQVTLPTGFPRGIKVLKK